MPHLRSRVSVRAIRVPLFFLGAAVTLGIVAGAQGLHSQRSLAAQLTPPAPPTYVPTPITPPPGPPTPSPTAGPAGTATPNATAAPSPTSSALDFSLDAVRLSKQHDPGDRHGLASVRPGTSVWLMMYFTMRSLPAPATRIALYEILSRGKILYRIGYSQRVKAHETGSFVRYVPYIVPRSMPYGPYSFSADLKLNGKSKWKSWKFSVGRQQREVAAAEKH